MNRSITFKGNPLILVGRNLDTGSEAPDFRVISQDLKEVHLSDFEGKIKILTSFPSLDTPVCDLQVKEFNKRATKFSSEIVVLAISKDLPFAQKRFCSENDIKNINVLSDYRFASFGLNYGLQIKELNLLARSILIADKNNILRYLQLVGELTQSPDFDGALKALEETVKSPASSAGQGRPSKCVPCETGTPPLPKEKVNELMKGADGWQLLEDKKIQKEFKFGDFAEAKYFLDIVSVIAEEQGHHPTMTIIYNKVKITLTTHASGGLTENDFIMARIIDGIGG